MKPIFFYRIIIIPIFIIAIVLSACSSQKIIGPFASNVKTFPEKYQVTLPYTNNCESSPIVQLNINGKLRNFMFDTGATMIISEELYNELGLSVNDSTKVRDAANNIQKTPYTYLPEIKVNDVSFYNIHAYIVKKESNSFWDIYNVDGIVGSSLFGNSIVKISSKGKSITLSNNADIIPKNIKPIKISYTKFQKAPYLMLKFFQGKRKANMQVLFDTGDNGLFSIEKSYIKGLRRLKIYPETEIYYGIESTTLFGADQLDSIYTVRFDSVKFNNFVLNNIYTTTAHAPRLGFQMTKYGEVTIDYIKNRFYFNPEGYPVYIKEKVQPITFIPKDGALTVGIIKAKELLSKIALGDKVISVNGFVINGVNLNTMCGIQNAVAQSDQVKYVFENKDGKQYTVETSKIIP